MFSTYHAFSWASFLMSAFAERLFCLFFPFSSLPFDFYLPIRCQVYPSPLKYFLALQFVSPAHPHAPRHSVANNSIMCVLLSFFFHKIFSSVYSISQRLLIFSFTYNSEIYEQNNAETT